MIDIAKNHESLDHVYGSIKDVLTQARSRAWQAVNAAMASSESPCERFLDIVDNVTLRFYRTKSSHLVADR